MDSLLRKLLHFIHKQTYILISVLQVKCYTYWITGSVFWYLIRGQRIDPWQYIYYISKYEGYYDFFIYMGLILIRLHLTSHRAIYTILLQCSSKGLGCWQGYTAGRKLYHPIYFLAGYLVWLELLLILWSVLIFLICVLILNLIKNTSWTVQKSTSFIH